jgi:hypothetical protein
MPTLIQVVPPDFCHVSKFQALAMDSSPPPYFNPDLRHCLPVLSGKKSYNTPLAPKTTATISVD